MAQKYNIVVPWSDFRLDRLRIDAALAPVISQRAHICAWPADCCSPEITKLQLLGVRRTSQESTKQILNSGKIRINGIKFYWLVAGHDALVHAMLLRRNRFNEINAASVRCVGLLRRTKLDVILNLSIRL